MPVDPPVTDPISTLVGGGDIASRVRCLIDDSAGSARRGPYLRWLVLAAIPAIAVLFAGYLPLLDIVHRATEVLVHRLP